MPQPKFLSDPHYKIQVLVSPAFLISNEPISLLEHASKADYLLLKFYYGAWRKKNRNLSLNKLYIWLSWLLLWDTRCPAVKAGKSVSNRKKSWQGKRKRNYMSVWCWMLQRKWKGKAAITISRSIWYSDKWSNEQCSVATMSEKQGVYCIRWP